MAVIPSKVSSAGKSAAGARFRQRKISVKVSLPIYNAKEISGPDSELEPSQLHHLNAASQQARDLHTVETGVDKNEEDEVHLQQVINAAQRVLLGSTKESAEGKDQTSVYIPTPDASKIWPDASKYYSDQPFVEPESYIKFSATVEDTLGVEYNMDEVDEKFFNDVLSKESLKNSDKPDSKTKAASNGSHSDSSEDLRKCSMLEFEAVCDKFEKTIEERQPFLSMDPSNILSYSELSAAILKDVNSTASNSPAFVQPGIDQKYIATSTLKERLSKELNFEPFVTTFDKDRQSTNSIRSIPKLLDLFGKVIYDHWRVRKIERKGKSITPSLKFEDPNANEKENDNDPYVCFRRREFRQARKTRRADNLGAERIRLLQKSLKRARELVLNVSKREILKLNYWEAEHEVFKLRCETKAVKRTAAIKGDDHLFYPHKRKKVIKPEPEDDEILDIVKTRKEKRKVQETALVFANSKEVRAQNGQIQPEASSTQPYVKLPPSKIPDMDLVTVSLVLKEKNETIKRAVLEKLKKRKEHDKGYANVTYDPHQPFFDISINKKKDTLELNHIPYSSIASSFYHQFNTTNMISDHLRKLMENGKRPYPGMKTFSGANGELIPSTAFPQLQSLLIEHLDNKLNSSSNYIAKLLSNMENNNFSSYTNGFRQEESAEDSTNSEISEPIFRLRKRAGRAGRVFVDRKGLVTRPNDAIDEWMSFEEDEEQSPKDAYHNKKDVISRMDSRWRFDDDYPEHDKALRDPFSLDPSRLNSISDDTQSIRFGSMLLSKSYDLLRESAHQRQTLMQQARMRALQQHQLQRTLTQSSGAAMNGSSSGGSNAVQRETTKTNSGLPANTTFRQAAVQGAYQGSAYGAGVTRGTLNFTPQQLQAMQQYRQQQGQKAGQGLATGFLAPGRTAMSGALSRGSMSPVDAKAAPKAAGEVSK